MPESVWLKMNLPALLGSRLYCDLWHLGRNFGTLCDALRSSKYHWPMYCNNKAASGVMTRYTLHLGSQRFLSALHGN